MLAREFAMFIYFGTLLTCGATRPQSGDQPMYASDGWPLTLSSYSKCPGQCIGTDYDDTFLRPGSCVCSSEEEPKDCSPKRQTWKQCKWPFTGEEFRSIGEGIYFNLSAAAPSGRLQGVQNYTLNVRVIHDLDDTIVCSGGQFPKGVDKICQGTQKGKLYPGVAEFFYALSLGNQQDVVWGVTKANPSVPFSARPNKLSAVLGVKRCRGHDLEFRRRVCSCSGADACESNARDCTCFGLDDELAQYGHTRDAMDFINGDFSGMGFTKFKNWRELRQSLNQPAVFVGDNGQGDLAASEMMLIASQRGTVTNGAVIAAFIHDVRQKCDDECRQAWALQNIFFFGTYGDAAEIAAKLGLIPDDFARKVVDAVYERSA